MFSVRRSDLPHSPQGGRAHRGQGHLRPAVLQLRRSPPQPDLRWSAPGWYRFLPGETPVCVLYSEYLNMFIFNVVVMQSEHNVDTAFVSANITSTAACCAR